MLLFLFLLFFTWLWQCAHILFLFFLFFFNWLWQNYGNVHVFLLLLLFFTWLWQSAHILFLYFFIFNWLWQCANILFLFFFTWLWQSAHMLLSFFFFFFFNWLCQCVCNEIYGAKPIHLKGEEQNRHQLFVKNRGDGKKFIQFTYLISLLALFCEEETMK